MPDAVLSAVVFLIGVELIDIKGMRKVYEQRRSEFWVAVITMLVVVFVGVEQGIILAVVLSLIDHTRRGYQPKNAVLVPTDSGVMRPQPVASGPSGKFCNIQSHCASANQGAFRRQWPLPWQETQHRVALAQRLPKGRATSIVGGVAALGKGLPFPADCALPTMLVARLSVTELSTWPTSKAEAEPGLLIYRFTHSMYYANSQQLTEEITGLVNNAEPPLRWLCIDASAVDDVDYSAVESLRSLFDMLKGKGVRLVVAQVMDDVREESRYQLRELFGADAFYDSLDDVLQAYRQQASAEAK